MATETNFGIREQTGGKNGHTGLKDGHSDEHTGSADLGVQTRQTHSY